MDHDGLPHLGELRHHRHRHGGAGGGVEVIDNVVADIGANGVVRHEPQELRAENGEEHVAVLSGHGLVVVDRGLDRGEAFALDAAQLDTLKKAGYTVPSPEEVIADAAAVKIEPPEGKRAYVVFDFKTGAFKVRTRTQTLAESEVGGFVGEVVSAAILCGFVERADMDKPKADAPATPTTASPLVNMLRDAFLRAANNKTAPAADKPAEAADAPEVVE